MNEVWYCGVLWLVLNEEDNCQIYLDGTTVDLYDFLDENTSKAIIRKANER
ncbi:hypothetical protein UFOVP207_33 [uncultured Caudovirales phage]|uniref:Uncharacterized protein n=1 Tax=uncultured Caudovirales phage TaxID=2100421 RepID=A0A6J7WMH8_9CAUD|nr:hypothetical protein UFOVP207_33 [uncultured Caudovirales phage]